VRPADNLLALKIMSENFVLSLIIVLFITSLIMCAISSNLIHTVFWLTSSFTFGSLSLVSVNLYFIGFIVMLIYLGAIAILFVFGVMLVHNNKKVVVKTEKGAIPFLFSISVLFLFTALEAVASVSELVKGLDPNQSSELLNVGFNMCHYLGNSLFISFLILCVPMIAIMLFVEE